MPDHCSAPGCMSGYDGQKGHSFHKFPDDLQMRQKWLRAIPRDTKTWTPSTHSRMCSLHFREEDYVDSRDKDIKRRQKKKTARKSLRKDAVPSIFPNLPQSLNPTPQALPREGHATASGRLVKEEKVLQDNIENFLQKEKLSSISDLKNKLGSVILPEGVDTIERDTWILFLALDLTDGAPMVQYSLSIHEDLSLKMSLQGDCVAERRVMHLLPQGNITVTAIGNILSFLKSQNEKQPTVNDVTAQYIKKVAEKLHSHAEGNIELMKKFSFLCEQLELALKTPATRRYSNDLLACCTLWENTSPALYKQIVSEGFLSLPSVRRIHQLSQALLTETGLKPSTFAYLKARSKNLSPYQKLIIVMFDEIYCAQRLEYASGAMHGMEEGNLCKTLLSFMIKSVCGKYSDVVALSPVTNLDAEKVEKDLLKVLEALHDIGFEVLLLSADNASPNRKCFLKLCDGTWKMCVENPCLPGKPLFLVFDSVHDFKNIYNNFQTRRTFVFPSLEQDGKKLTAQFNHLEELYKLELLKPAKMAYKLNDRVLHPSSLEKTNVQLADSLFHDSTIAALDHYSRDHLEWRQTATFLKIVREWWNRVNVKTPTLGIQMRDDTRKPIYSMDDTKFLVSFSSWLQS